MYNIYVIPYNNNDNYFTNGLSDDDINFLGLSHLYHKQMFQESVPHLPFNIVFSPTEKYLFPIRSDMLLSYGRENFFKNFTFTIPSNVLNDIKQNSCKLLIDNSIENYDVVTNNYESDINNILLRTINKYNLRKSDVILITGNYKSQTSDKYTVAIKTWSDTLITPSSKEFFDLQKNLILSKKIRNKKILTFMRKERITRFYLADFIYRNNLRDFNIVTFGKNVSSVFWNAGSKHFPQSFIDSLPWEYDVDLHLKDKHLEFVLAKNSNEINAYTETYINCVVERSIHFDKHELDVSEKLFKPIAFLQPFMVIGQPGTLEYIKDRGYKTFDRWWNESYDKQASDQIRFNLLVKLYKKLSLTSHTELADLMYEAWPILEHNYYTYSEYYHGGKSNQHLLKTIDESFDK
jgi:hypothetical protein